jgi:hypothetical protein
MMDHQVLIDLTYSSKNCINCICYIFSLFELWNIPAFFWFTDCSLGLQKQIYVMIQLAHFCSAYFNLWVSSACPRISSCMYHPRRISLAATSIVQAFRCTKTWSLSRPLLSVYRCILNSLSAERLWYELKIKRNFINSLQKIAGETPVNVLALMTLSTTLYFKRKNCIWKCFFQNKVKSNKHSAVKDAKIEYNNFSLFTLLFDAK